MLLTGCNKVHLAGAKSDTCFGLSRPARFRLRLVLWTRRLNKAHTHGITKVTATSTLEQTQTTQNPQVAEPLNWTKQWYPVHSTMDLDPAKPHAVNLLGKELVVWNDGQQWRCFEDLCPHRKVPLSEGRVEAGKLECAYHGWKFDSIGKPVSIPQVSDREAEAKAAANMRSCCTSFPTQTQQGLIWVWPESGPSASLESAVQEPALCPQYQTHQDSWAWTFQHFVRDVPGSFEFWMENMMDQSHVPHAHTDVAAKSRIFEPGAELFKFLGSDTKDGKPQAGFDVNYKVAFSAENLLQQKLYYRPPALCRFSSAAGEASGFALWIYAVPTTSNSTRLIISAGLNPSKAAAFKPDPKAGRVADLKRSLLRKVFTLRPRWLGHMTLNGITDGDITFMHRQSSYAKQQGDRRPASHYFLPSPSDKGVSIWYQWLRSKAGGGPEYTDNKPIQTFKTALGSLDRAALLDRQNHVRNCASCTKALQQVQALQQGAKVGSAVALLMTAGLLGQGTNAISVPVVSALLLAAGCSVADVKLQQLQKHFGFLDWQHSEH